MTKKSNKQDNRQSRNEWLTLGESFPVVYTIVNSQIRTFFSLRELGTYSPGNTVIKHAQKYGIAKDDFICKIHGICDFHQVGHNNFYIMKGGWMEYSKVGDKLTLKTSVHDKERERKVLRPH